ncbi:septum formation initiator family protein [Roseicyclus sp. F158]|uniref:Septum formation initiator family protein n=1 Tax=Tropicimonas omnivorans TaxID=3075590 RepID=A0ABU3DIT3_9RHOB|nr:septum formation initiator family protein [Roseicyclus sp. F158]MDT0683634.1 septum formation initiator family protein [Roseicyclus sp. F158]
MGGKGKRPGVGAAVFFTLAMALGAYFTFAAVQGDYGLFRRMEIDAATRSLERERIELEAQVAALENKTHRLSDSYLDIDLLDQQARSVLGLVRADEVIFD